MIKSVIWCRRRYSYADSDGPCKEAREIESGDGGGARARDRSGAVLKGFGERPTAPGAVLLARWTAVRRRNQRTGSTESVGPVAASGRAARSGAGRDDAPKPNDLLRDCAG